MTPGFLGFRMDAVMLSSEVFPLQAPLNTPTKEAKLLLKLRKKWYLLSGLGRKFDKKVMLCHV